VTEPPRDNGHRSEAPGTGQQDLPPIAGSVHDARVVVGDVLSGAGFQGDVDAALLLTSEVVTNAVRHAATPIHLSVVASADSALVTVVDRDPDHLPVVRTNLDPLADGGRGLHILERMAQTWGVDQGSTTKTVWFIVT
jgi:anti-sigma regulatory factor (Ser/Thr protein kinase)